MKLYYAVQHFLTGKFVHYFVLFFITLSIAAVMGTSFESLAPFRVELFTITYISSFVFLLEFAARIFAAPSLHPTLRKGQGPAEVSVFVLRLCRLCSHTSLRTFVLLLEHADGSHHCFALHFHHFQAHSPLPVVSAHWACPIVGSRRTHHGLHRLLHHGVLFGHTDVLH